MPRAICATACGSSVAHIPRARLSSWLLDGETKTVRCTIGSVRRAEGCTVGNEGEVQTNKDESHERESAVGEARDLLAIVGEA